MTDEIESPDDDHSHSTFSKVFDELDAVVDVVEQKGPTPDLCEELQTFARQLSDVLAEHVEYEESDLFPRLERHLSDEQTQHLQAALAQHRTLESGVEELHAMIDELDSASSAGVTSIRRQLDHLRDLFDEHDRTEAAAFAAMGDEDADSLHANERPRLAGSGAPAFETAIIGAGVVGLSIAWRLLERGHEVLLIEREQAGAGASTAAAGMLAPTTEAQFGEEELYDFQRRSMELYPEFVDALSTSSDTSVELDRTATLFVARDRDETEALERVLCHRQSLGAEASRLSPAEAREREPGLRSVHSAGLFPEDHLIDNRRLVDALATACRQSGGTLWERTPADALWMEDSEVHGLELGNPIRPDRVAADRVVVAAGAWSGQFDQIPELTGSTLRPVRGEALALDLGDPPICEHVLRCPDVYLVPRPSSELVVGATSEERGFERAVTGRGLREPLDEAWKMLPAIDEQPFRRAWAGLRPVSLDGAPLLGRSSIEGLWLATGHGRHGIMMAPLTADLMVRAIEGEGEPASEWEAVDPGRFP
ncbi:MAG: glycine oxidase ThiO [Bradymonadaceae bacterium]